VSVPDFRVLFAGLPTAYLVMNLELVIVEANTAYLNLLGHQREDLVGRYAFDAFPPMPEALDDQGHNPLQVSVEKARDTGQPDLMPLFKYDVVHPVSGEVAERYWSLVNTALRDSDGRVAWVLQRVEDVTDYVRERQVQRAHVQLGQQRVEAIEADLFRRVEQLRAAQQARDETARRLASLNDVALALTAADSVRDLEQIVIGRGLVVLGADGGAVTTKTGHGAWRVTVSDALGKQVQSKYADVPFDSPLPAIQAARTGQRVELPTVATGLAEFPVMESVYEETGRHAWVFLPLTVKGECLGSLAVSWVQERLLLTDELDLLEAFAAQCAQTLSRLQARDAERQVAAADHRMAETLQRALLTEPVQPDHLQIAVRYLPALDGAQVGGDWYDAFLTGDGATSLVIGDIGGHDREAAAIMGQVRNLVRGIGYALRVPPAILLTQLDRALRDLGIDALATMVLAQIEQDRAAATQGLRVLRWSNAGHPPPVLLHPDGRAELLNTAPDLLLGLDPASPRTDHQVTLQPGDTVLLYTDGLIERRDASLEDGLQWLVQATRDLAALPLEQLCDQLLTGVGDLEDDTAILAVRAHPEDQSRPAPAAGPARVPNRKDCTGTAAGPRHIGDWCRCD